jgi:hypothetical protein
MQQRTLRRWDAAAVADGLVGLVMGSARFFLFNIFF